MKSSDLPHTHLTRRACLVWLGSALSACGGGGSLASSAPGTGGTGSPLYAQGAISGFGSVIVNSIKFDDTQATIHLDGIAANSADLRLGMVAGVQGQRSTVDSALGTAEAIEVWSIALGPVLSVKEGAFEMLGMTIQTDLNTRLEGFDKVSDISAGQTVAVWGLQVDADGTQWRATRLKLEASSTSRVATGLVRQVDGKTNLNAFSLSGELAEDLSAGTMVRVEGTLDEDSKLAVSGSQLLNSGFEIYADGVLEIEGVVTRLLSASQFMMGTTTVDASKAELASIVSRLSVGQEIEVYGEWSAGTLLATRIVLEGDESREIEIGATIDQFTSVADFVMRGQRCDASAATFSGGRASDLAVGKVVTIHGTMDGAVLKVTELEFVH